MVPEETMEGEKIESRVWWVLRAVWARNLLGRI
jgi:hypothetical protein